MSSIHRFRATILTALAGVGLSAQVCGAEVYVIAHSPVQLSAAEIREVFLGERQFALGQRLVVIDNASAMSKFVDEACGIDAARYRTVWTKKGFREGLNPPLQLTADRDVWATVRSTPGAIGYVSAVPPGANVILAY